MDKFSVGDVVTVVDYDSENKDAVDDILGHTGTVKEFAEGGFVMVTLDKAIDNLEDWLFYPSEIEKA